MPSSGGAPRRRRRGREDASFSRVFTATVVALALFCAVFATLTILQGPKLSSAVVDSALVVRESGQALRLFANQQLAHVGPEQVTVTPAAAFSVSTSDDVVSIIFEERLHYGTDYFVQVDGVTSLYQDRPATLQHEFSTASSEAYVLDRAAPDSGEQDRIMRGELGGDGLGALEQVHSAERILDFVVTGQAIAVVTEPEAGQHQLSVVSLFDGAIENIPLPGTGTIDQLQASDSDFAVGFRFTSAGDPLTREFAQTLMWMDLEGVHIPAPLTGISGDAISVSEWAFVPPAGVVAALGIDQTLLLVDPRETQPTLPLGSWEGLDDVSSDGSTAIVRDLYDTIILSLVDGAAEPFGPSPIDGELPFAGEVELLGNGPDRVQKVSVYDAASGVFASRVVVDDGSESRTILASETGRGSVEEISVSPNGQYVAVEFVPDVQQAVPDAYYPFAKADTVRTVIIEISSGRAVSEVEGHGIAW